MKLYLAENNSDIKRTMGFPGLKVWGKIFLTDKNTIDKIIDQSNICHDDLVIVVLSRCHHKRIAIEGRICMAIEIDKG